MTIEALRNQGSHGRMNPGGGLRRLRGAGARHVTRLGHRARFAVQTLSKPLPQVSCLARLPCLPNGSRPATGRVPARAALKPLVHGLASVVDADRARLVAVGERNQEVGQLGVGVMPDQSLSTYRLPSARVAHDGQESRLARSPSFDFRVHHKIGLPVGSSPTRRPPSFGFPTATGD